MTSSIIDEKLVTNLECLNSTEQYSDGVVILLRLLDNVIREPQNNKYRTIRLENKVIKEKLLCLSGIRELLTSIGFDEVCTDSVNRMLTCFGHYARHYVKLAESEKKFDSEI